MQSSEISSVRLRAPEPWQSWESSERCFAGVVRDTLRTDQQNKAVETPFFSARYVDVLVSTIKRAALYMRVSSADQHPETQLLDLRAMAKQRGYEVVREYSDVVSGAKQKRPGLDQLMTDARRGRLDVVLVVAFDRVARSTRHFLEVLDELNRLNVEFISCRENVDTGGPLGRAMVVIIGAIAELERSLIIERVRAGMRRAKLEGRRIGRAPLRIDRSSVVRDRLSGQSLTKVAKTYGISRALVCSLVNEAKSRVVDDAAGGPNSGVREPTSAVQCCAAGNVQ